MELVKQAYAPMKENTIRIIMRKTKGKLVLQGKLDEKGVVVKFRKCIADALGEIEKDIQAKLKEVFEPKNV